MSILILKCEWDIDLDLVLHAETLLMHVLVLTPGDPCAFTVVVITTSSSGYAFSVTSARGRFSSARGQAGITAETTQVPR